VIAYRVKLTSDEGTFLVTSPDFPELTTFGETQEDALGYAVGAFEEAIAARIAYREPVPSPSKGKASDPKVELPFQTEVKILLYQEMHKDGVKKSDLAKKMNLHRQEMDRLLKFGHATSIGKIESAFAAMGKRIHLEVADVD
jgi:antitoxin HicB